MEVPAPALALGLAAGVGYALLAMGLVLAHRSSGVINFAHGAIGGFAGAVLGVVVSRDWLPYWIGYAAAVAVGAALGALSELVVVRRLRQAPPEMAVLATLGISGVLVPLTVALQMHASPGASFPSPSFVPSFTVGAAVFTRADAALLVVALVVAAAGGFVLRHTTFGLRLRAAADNRDSARLVGIPADAFSTVAWATSGGLAAACVAFLLPGAGFIAGETVGTSLLLRALAVALAARLVSLPRCAVIGVALGVVEAVVRWNVAGAGVTNLVTFGVIVLALVRRGRRERTAPSAAWAVVRGWVPLPADVRALPVVRALSLGAVAVALAVAALAPSVVTPVVAITLVQTFCLAIVGLSVGVVTGLAGRLSVGQFAFAGIGATVAWAVGVHSGSFVVGVASGCVAAAATNVALGVAALRLRGPTLAVATLGFAIATETWLLRQPWVLGDGVHPARPVIGGFAFDTSKRYYFVALVALGLALAVTWRLRSTTAGDRIVAVRDNRDAAAGFGIRVRFVEVYALGVAGALAGLGGAVYAHSVGRLDAGTFPVRASIDVVAMAAIGGLGFTPGPLLGALYLVTLPELVDLNDVALATTAAGWLALVVALPGGLAQPLRYVRDRVVATVARRAGVEPGVVRAPVHVDGVPPVSVRRDQTPATGVVLTLRGVRRRFGATTVLDGVDLSVAAGEIVGVVGANGAGKTTLLDVISGVVAPDAGVVETPPHGGTVRTLQDGRLFPALTVEQTLGLVADRDAARGALRSHGLTAWRSTPVGHLSTGTRRIVELACLRLLHPAVVLLDEPSAGIAAAETPAVAANLRALRDDTGAALIVTSHDHALLQDLCDRVVELVDGALRPVAAAPRRATPKTTECRVALNGASPSPLGSRLACRDVGVALDGHSVVAGVDFFVAAGEAVGLVGTNGAGKSTLLRAIAGLVPIARGSVAVDGASLDAASVEARARAGVLLVEGGRTTFPSLTVEETLRAVQPSGPLAGSVERFAALSRRRSERSGDLSGGEQQLLALLRAVVLRPRLLLVDEFALGLSPTAAEDAAALLAELRDAGTAVVVVDQSVDRVASVADRVCFLEKGEIRFDGSVGALRRRRDLLRPVFLAR